jgi:hypothetical protein
MKTTPTLGLMVAVAVTFIGCSNGEDHLRAGTSGAAGGQGGAAEPGGQGAATGGATSLVRGDVLEFVPAPGDVPYAIGPNAYGIQGGGFLARAANGNSITIGSGAGQICISGNLEAVPNGNYSGYWGVEIGFNLNQGLAEGGGGAGGAGGWGGAGGDGGGMAGAAGDVARPWMPGHVIGFSFVIEGPTIDLIRFKALPAGLDPALESSVYCKSMTPSTGAVDDVLFSQMIQYCWNANGALLPLDNGLDNLSWQLPAEVGVTRPFDWCVKDLRPILAN